MGKIVELAKKRFWNTEIFELIESRIEKIERDIEYLLGQVKENFWSIGALEKKVYPKEPEESIPTDKFGNPEGGLEPGDVISYIIDQSGGKRQGEMCLGQFSRQEGETIWGYWQNWNTGEFEEKEHPMPKDRVTFKFRPEPKEV